MKRWYSKGLSCLCGTPISNNSASGKCRPCFMAHLHATTDPAKRGETYRRKLREDPEARRRHCEAARKGARTKSKNLPMMERLSRNMRDNIRPLSQTPEALARRDPIARGRAVRAAKLAWCPEEFWDEYQRLHKSGRMTGAEARVFILAKSADIAAARSGHVDDAIRWLNRIAPCRKLDSGLIRYGMGELRPAEVIDRAKLKGWEPERLAA